MYPCDLQGAYEDDVGSAILAYLTAQQADPVPASSFMMQPQQFQGSSAAGKSTCFSMDPGTALDVWKHKLQSDWTPRDVLGWIMNVAGASYEQVNLSNFSEVTGSTLLTWTRQDFRGQDPQYGDLLYDALNASSSSSSSHLRTLAPLTGISCKQQDQGASPDDLSFTDSNDPYSYPPHAPCPQDCKDSDSDSASGSEVEPVPKKLKRPPGRPPGAKAKAKAKAEKKTGRLWEFIRNLLHNPETCPSVICWEDHDQGVFRFVKSEKVAKIWGRRKNNEKMNYEKLSRAMRYYYKSQVLLPVLGRKLVYKFGPNARNWRSDNPNFRQPPNT